MIVHLGWGSEAAQGGLGRFAISLAENSRAPAESGVRFGGGEQTPPKESFPRRVACLPPLGDPVGMLGHDLITG